MIVVERNALQQSERGHDHCFCSTYWAQAGSLRSGLVKSANANHHGARSTGAHCAGLLLRSLSYGKYLVISICFSSNSCRRSCLNLSQLRTFPRESGTVTGTRGLSVQVPTRCCHSGCRHWHSRGTGV